MLKTFLESDPQKAYELRRTPDLRTNKYNVQTSKCLQRESIKRFKKKNSETDDNGRPQVSKH